ncbi:MAG: response regulator [Chloroflexota bacterium]|nr:response regulator [Chloroflexota bacterium]
MKRVLIVDDEAEIVELVSMVLEDDNISLFAAYDGEEALHIVHAERPHLVLSDIMMPRLDGRELCKRIRSDPATSNTIIILMSAVHRLDAADCGADELIRKPFDILSVTQIVNRFLEQAVEPDMSSSPCT